MVMRWGVNRVNVFWVYLSMFQYFRNVHLNDNSLWDCAIFTLYYKQWTENILIFYPNALWLRVWLICSLVFHILACSERWGVVLRRQYKKTDLLCTFFWPAVWTFCQQQSLNILLAETWQFKIVTFMHVFSFYHSLFNQPHCFVFKIVLNCTSVYLFNLFKNCQNFNWPNVLQMSHE